MPRVPSPPPMWLGHPQDHEAEGENDQSIDSDIQDYQRTVGNRDRLQSGESDPGPAGLISGWPPEASPARKGAPYLLGGRGAPDARGTGGSEGGDGAGPSNMFRKVSRYLRSGVVKQWL